MNNNPIGEKLNVIIVITCENAIFHIKKNLCYNIYIYYL